MKPYQELTFKGKLRRLGELAASALAQYDLENPQLTFHTFDTNLLYRVTTPSGERFMLRLAYPGWRTFSDLQSEALWLEALSRDTSIPIPRILPTRSGEYVQPLSRADIPRVWNASLMRWLPGRLLGHYLSERNLEKMGALFAELHHHGASWTPPTGFTTRRFEHWLSRDEPNLITSAQDIANERHTSDPLPTLSPDQRQLLEHLHQHIENAYASLDRTDLRVIHCDLWHDNIKLHHGHLQPLDFEDTIWGFRAHDIAMAMLDLLESTDDLRYPGLLGAFQRGYQAYLSWPEAPIEPFQIGRLLWKINWVARFQPNELQNMLERHIPVFNHYEKTGRVIQP